LYRRAGLAEFRCGLFLPAWRWAARSILAALSMAIRVGSAGSDCFQPAPLVVVVILAVLGLGAWFSSPGAGMRRPKWP